MNNQIKIRYKTEDYKKLQKKAEKLGLSIREYQKMISKKARVRIESEDE